MKDFLCSRELLHHSRIKAAEIRTFLVESVLRLELGQTLVKLRFESLPALARASDLGKISVHFQKLLNGIEFLFHCLLGALVCLEKKHLLHLFVSHSLIPADIICFLVVFDRPC